MVTFGKLIKCLKDLLVIDFNANFHENYLCKTELHIEMATDALCLVKNDYCFVLSFSQNKNRWICDIQLIQKRNDVLVVFQVLRKNICQQLVVECLLKIELIDHKPILCVVNNLIFNFFSGCERKQIIHWPHP